MLGKRFSLGGQLFREAVESLRGVFQDGLTQPWRGVGSRLASVGGLGWRPSRVPSSSYFRNSTSSSYSSDQSVPVLSHPTRGHAGERGQLLLNAPFLTEARWEGGQEPEACGQSVRDWVNGFVLHSG